MSNHERLEAWMALEAAGAGIAGMADGAPGWDAAYQAMIDAAILAGAAGWDCSTIDAFGRSVLPPGFWLGA